MNELHDLAERLLAGVEYDPEQIAASKISSSKKACCFSAAKLLLQQLPPTPDGCADFFLVQSHGIENHFMAGRLSPAIDRPDRFFMRTSSIDKTASPRNRLGRVERPLGILLLDTLVPVEFSWDIDTARYRQGDGSISLLAIPRAMSGEYIQRLQSLGAGAGTWQGALACARE